MSFLGRTFKRIRALLARRKLDAEMDEEMRSHLELRTAANIELGMEPEEARFAALRQFGRMEAIKETCREQRGIPWIETLLRDLHYAARQLRKSIGFSAVAIVTLALGIGANAIVFTVARTVLFRPLGFQEEDRLMWIRLVNTQTGAAEDQLSWQDLEDIRTLSRSFESIVTDSSSDARWEDGDRMEDVPVVRATPELTRMLRLQPVLGRLFQPSDSEPASESVVLISQELWHSRFGGSSNILGQTVRLNQRVHTIVGVLPPRLEFPVQRAPAPGAGSILKAGQKHFWIPMRAPEGEDRTSRAARMFLGMGRLKPGVSEETARAELASIARRLAVDFPVSNRNWTFDLLSFRDQVFGHTRRGLPLLAGAVAAVLLICCVNLANLLLARGVTRQRELAVRLALGASRGSLLRSVMTENFLLALLGGLLGLVLTHGALAVIHKLAANIIPFIREATVTGPAIAFTFGLSLVTALVFGLLPAIRQSSTGTVDALRAGTRSTETRRIRAWHQGLLVGQVALVLVLLASAGLLLESFRRLLGQDLGYQPGSVLSIDLSTRGDDFSTNGDLCRMYRSLQERLAALPGVEAVGTISSTPLTGKWTFYERPNVVGQSLPEADRPIVSATFVAFDYFQAMGIPLRDGRFFHAGELDDDGYGRLVILNQAAAAALFPGRSAIGGRFTVGSNPDRLLEVIGVVQDTRDVRLEERPKPRMYWQYAFGGAQVIVRSRNEGPLWSATLRAAVEQADPRAGIDRIRPMTEIIAGTVAERRFLMILLVTYAAIALGIAAVGIFGVVAYQVAQRRNEFGVRLALGGTARDLIRLVLARVGALTAFGLLIGLVISFMTNQLLSSQLFGLSPHDPVLLSAVCGVILFVAIAASLIPARQTARINPIEALRHE